MWIVFNRYSIIFGAFMPHFICAVLIASSPKAFWIIQIVSGGMFKLNAKFDADLLFYLLSHFECKGHTVHMLTHQGCLPPLLTSTVKLSLFMHMHSGPFCLAARLHRCCTNHSHNINNGWPFSRQTLYICTPLFLAALFMVAKTWKQLMCPLVDGWIKKMWYI